jgi:hypothetical protein
VNVPPGGERSCGATVAIGFVAFGLGLAAVGCRSPGHARPERQIVLPTHTFVRFETPNGRSLANGLDELSTRKEDRVDFRVRVIAVATRERPGQRLSATIQADHGWNVLGRWQLPHWKEHTKVPVPAGCDGQLLTDLAPPFFVSAVVRDEVLQTQEVRVQDSIVTFVIDPSDVRARLAGFRLRLLDSSRQPLDWATVELTDAGSAGGGWKTGKDGRVAVAYYLPGLLILRIEAAGQGKVSRWVRLPPGRVTDLGDVVLDPATVIEGRVTDAEGFAVPGIVYFYFLDDLTFPQSMDALGWSMRAKGGRFRYEVCRRGHYLILVRSAFATRALVVDTSAGDVRGVDIRVEAGTSVTFEGAPADRGLLVEVRDGSGLPVVSHRFFSLARFERLLAPGAYTLSVYEDETVIRRQSFAVGTVALTLWAGR